MYLIVISSMVAISGIIHAQDTDPYLPFAEQMPEPIGGIESIYKKITYPDAARSSRLEGKVYVQVFVDESGNVNDVKVLKDIGLGCGKAAADAIKRTKYKPGHNQGVAVKVKMAMAITFQLK